MKKVTAFIASQQKRATYAAVRQFEGFLRSRMEVDFEVVFLKDYHLEYCRGCRLCFEKGEEHCPLQDDRGILIQKIRDSDGVIFATPNHTFQLAAPMKTFLDSLAYMLHRPCFFGKTCTAIVTQGFIGGNDILKYLENAVGKNLGFTVAKGCVLQTLEPETPASRSRATQRLQKAATRFHKQLTRPGLPVPSLFQLMKFRLSRVSIRQMLGEASRDYRHYREHGWFESDYFYPVSLGAAKRAAGRLFDALGAQLLKQR